MNQYYSHFELFFSDYLAFWGVAGWFFPFLDLRDLVDGGDCYSNALDASLSGGLARSFLRSSLESGPSLSVFWFIWRAPSPFIMPLTGSFSSTSRLWCFVVCRSCWLARSAYLFIKSRVSCPTKSCSCRLLILISNWSLAGRYEVRDCIKPSFFTTWPRRLRGDAGEPSSSSCLISISFITFLNVSFCIRFYCSSSFSFSSSWAASSGLFCLFSSICALALWVLSDIICK